MWDGFNQRKFPRLPLRCKVIVQPERSKSKFMVKTQNMSLGGVCALLPKPLTRMKICKIKLKISPRHSPIEGLGRISWSIATREHAQGKKMYDVGIEFIQFAPEGLDKLRHYLGKK